MTRRPHLIVQQLHQIGYLWKLPLPNMRMGIAAENQECFDRRWAAFREFPLANKLLVYRPPLGAINLPADAQGQLEEVIFGGGTKAPRGTSNRILVRQRQFASTASRP